MSFRRVELPLLRVEVSIKDKAIEMWMMLWCFIFSSHDKCEHIYRLDELVQVLNEYTCTDINRLIDIYNRIIETCYKFGSARLTIIFFDRIKQPIISSHPSILKWYMLSITKTLEEDKNHNNSPIIEYSQKFQERSFLTHRIQGIQYEEVKIGIGLHKCEKCDKVTPDRECLDKKVDTFECIHCNAQLVAEIRVRIGRPILHTKSIWQEQYLLYPLDTIKKDITSDISLISLRNNQQLFWNIIWYCQRFKLPYDLFIPYKSTLKASIPACRKPVRMNTGIGFALPLVENQWLDNFKQAKVLMFCNEKETQTD